MDVSVCREQPAQSGAPSFVECRAQNARTNLLSLLVAAARTLLWTLLASALQHAVSRFHVVHAVLRTARGCLLNVFADTVREGSEQYDVSDREHTA